VLAELATTPAGRINQGLGHRRRRLCCAPRTPSGRRP
jgi:hypothetical protein